MAFKYVTVSGGASTKDGTTWATAWAGASMGSPSPGDVVLIAAGNYSNLAPFSTSGTSANPITYTAVSSTAIGTGTTAGQVSNGTTQQVIVQATGINITGSWIILSGGLWTPPWKSGGNPTSGPPTLYGIKYINGPITGGNIFSFSGSNQSFINMEISGPAPTSNGYNLTTGGLTAFYGGSSVLVSGCKIHDMDGPFYYLMNGAGSVIEYCTIYNVSSNNQITGSGPHPDLCYNNQTSTSSSYPLGLTIRYCVFANCVSEGIFFDNGNGVAGGSFCNLIMYGNLMFQGDTAGLSSGSDTAQCDALEIKTQVGNFGAFYIYNNTFVDWGGSSKPGLNSDGSGWISHLSSIQNNLFANTSSKMGAVDSGSMTHSFNAYFQANASSPSDSHPINLSGNPFSATVSNKWVWPNPTPRLGPAPNTQTRPTPLGYDPTPYVPSFFLNPAATGTTALSGATTIPTPGAGLLGITHTFNTDMFGNTGGAFGAFQAQGALPAATPTVVQHVSTASNTTVIDLNGIAPHTGSPFKLPLPNLTLAGNALVLDLSATYSAGRTISVTDDKGNVWQQKNITHNAGNTVISAQFVAVGIAASTSLLTVTFDAAVVATFDITEYNNVTGVDVVGALATSSGTVNSGSFTPTSTGDLIHTYGCDTTDWNGSSYAITSIAPGSGFKLLSSNLYQGTFVENQQVTGAVAITPSATITGGSAVWNCLSLALVAAATGATDSRAMRVVGVKSYLQNRPTVATELPCVGNLLLLTTSFPSSIVNVSGVTDNQGNTWQKATVANFPQVWYCVNATPSNTLKVSMTLTAGASNSSGGLMTTFVFYDCVGAAAASFDSVAGIVTQAVTNQNNTPITLPTISPSTPNGIVFAVMGNYYGPTLGLSNAAQRYDSPTYTGQIDNDNLINADGYAHFYNTAAGSVSFTWTMASVIVSELSSALAIAFKSSGTTAQSSTAGATGHAAVTPTSRVVRGATAVLK